MTLLGVDVGFSARRAKTGIAYLHNDNVRVVRVSGDRAERRAVLPRNFSGQAAAFDGLVLPADAAPFVHRVCEHAFIRDALHNRCKPGAEPPRLWPRIEASFRRYSNAAL